VEHNRRDRISTSLNRIHLLRTGRGGGGEVVGGQSVSQSHSYKGTSLSDTPTPPQPSMHAVQNSAVLSCCVRSRMPLHVVVRGCKSSPVPSRVVCVPHHLTCSRILGLSALLQRSRAASISRSRCALRRGSGGVTHGHNLAPSSSRHADDCTAQHSTA